MLFFLALLYLYLACADGVKLAYQKYVLPQLPEVHIAIDVRRYVHSTYRLCTTVLL